ncbi:hypothetical protein K1X12_01705 [Hyphomonas sp. WL0036]|uniref:hypothetical protein n=1 Tax=Hyphomonas sediminis TaxID=2866160 RepID=UPI001C7E5981|nr:hypothetical protein [Hyphomonas sediminis]MBY9065593.1 hypothetical protein [Hyphomonas sediminis]
MSKSPNSVLNPGKKPRVKRRNAKWTANLAKRAKIRVFGNTKRARLARKKAARA